MFFCLKKDMIESLPLENIMAAKSNGKCSKCHKRKAKRTCAALGTKICPLCCGKLRGKEINCPQDCPYLDRHSSYQEKRLTDREGKSAPPPSQDILRDERLAWLVLHAEIPVFEFAKRDPQIGDRDVYFALDHAHRNLERKSAVFILTQNRLDSPNPLGEAILKNMDMCRYQKKIILPGESLSYSTEEKIKGIERVQLAVRTAAGRTLSGRNYLEQLFIRMARLQTASSQTRIISG